MESRNMKFIAKACAGKQSSGSPDLLVSGVCTDSRRAQAGDLCVALRGERYDGHNFLHDAIEKGATAVMVGRKEIPAKLPKCAIIGVSNTRKALGKLAAAYRKDFSQPIIVVGGSNGKTTTKDLIASVLRQKLAALWSN